MRANYPSTPSKSMKPVTSLTRGHVFDLVKHIANQLGHAQETKLPRGLVDSCIRAGATAAENAIEAAVNAALAPKSPEYFVPSRLIPKAVTEDCTGTPLPELCTSTCEATTPIPVKASAILESLTLDEPMTPSAAVAFLEELKTPTAEVCPLAKTIGMADAVVEEAITETFGDAAIIAPLQLVTEPVEVEPDFPFDDGDDVPDENPFGNDDDAPDFPDEPLPGDEIVTAPSEPEKQLLSVEQFIELHKLNIVKTATTAGEWFCCRGDLDNSVLASKPAAEAAIRQGIIVGGDSKANAVENYASLNGLSLYA